MPEQEKEAKKMLNPVRLHEVVTLTDEDLEKGKEIAADSCPRRYCWWWASLAFDWNLTPREGCTFLKTKKHSSWRSAEIPCCRSDPSSSIDHFEPRDPQIEEDKMDPSKWLNYKKMESSLRSPFIKHISWGRMEVDGLGIGRDFKLFPGGGREWDWTETNTHHVPGIQPADVEELLEHGSRVVVLTRGMQLVLQTCPETLAMLRDRGIQVHVEETKAAVELYNKLAETEPVGGLFHSTC